MSRSQNLLQFPAFQNSPSFLLPCVLALLIYLSPVVLPLTFSARLLLTDMSLSTREVMQEKQGTDFQKTGLQDKFLMIRSKLSEYARFTGFQLILSWRGLAGHLSHLNPKHYKNRHFRNMGKIGFGRNTVFASISTEFGAPILQNKKITESNCIYIYIYAEAAIYIYIYICCRVNNLASISQ